MNQEILDYLQVQRVGVLAVEMPDGSPHAATVHFAHSASPFVFYFETYNDSRKGEAILSKPQTRASLVIGSSEDDIRTLQMDGLISLVKNDEVRQYEEVYLGKFPDKVAKSKTERFVRFKFEPTWWRFTDWTGSEGKKIISSK